MEQKENISLFIQQSMYFVEFEPAVALQLSCEDGLFEKDSSFF